MTHTAMFMGWKDQPVSKTISAILHRHFQLVHVNFYDFGDREKQSALARLEPDYLFSFGPLIIKPVLLNAVRKAAINFHTAPPEYPGRGGCSYAIYNQDQEFGVTAHLMTEKIDDGKIIKVIRFSIETNPTPQKIHYFALGLIPSLVQSVIDMIKGEGLTFDENEQWNGKTKTQADFEEFMEMTIRTNEGVMRRKIQACQHPDKPGPYLMFRGVKFFYIEGKS